MSDISIPESVLTGIHTVWRSGRTNMHARREVLSILEEEYPGAWAWLQMNPDYYLAAIVLSGSKGV